MNGRGRVQIKFETQRAINFLFLFFLIYGAVRGAYPLKNTTTVLTFSEAIRGYPPISRPGRVEIPGPG